MARTKSKSRSKRWEEACQAVRERLEAAKEAHGELASAFSDLRDIQQEFEDWKDNMSDNLQSTPVYEKLETVCNIDLDWDEEGDLSDAESSLDEAENADLPLGFGRD